MGNITNCITLHGTKNIKLFADVWGYILGFHLQGTSGPVSNFLALLDS
jgi:hypothetical protein